MKKKIKICLFAVTILINSLTIIKAINMHNNRIELILNLQSVLESEWKEEHGEEANISYKSNFKGITIIHETKNGNKKQEYELKNSAYIMFCYLIIINLIIFLIVIYRKFNKRFTLHLKECLIK